MNIGLFTDGYLPEISGVTSSVLWLKEELEALGHAAYVYAPHYDELSGDEHHVFRFRSQPFLFHRASRVALPYDRAAMRSFRELDVIHSHSPFSLGVVALAAARRHRTPHVHTYHTYLAEYRRYLPRLLRPPRRTTEEASAVFCNRCTAVTAPSEAIRQELLRYGVRRPIHVFPYGVKLSLFEADPVWSPRSVLGIREDVLLLLYSGRLAQEKNLPFLLDVFARLRASEPRAVLVLAGDGPMRIRLEAQAAERGLNEAVTFTGFLDHARLVDLYKAADLFVFASKTETQGLAILEAMAGGTPAVAIGEMGVLDILEDEVNGCLAPENEDGFAARVAELLADDARRARLGEGARRTAERLSTHHSTCRLLEIYETCQTT